MTANPPRRRGDKHPIYRIFIGWGELDDTYHLTGSRHYRFTGQRCGAKVIYSIEQVLLNVIDSNNTSKFNSNLEKSESTLPNEINKATFIKMLQKRFDYMGNSPSIRSNTKAKCCHFLTTTINLRLKRSLPTMSIAVPSLIQSLTQLSIQKHKICSCFILSIMTNTNSMNLAYQG